MTIMRYEKEQELLNSWKDDIYEAYSLAPGVAKNSDELFSDESDKYSYMCSSQVGSRMESVFGKSLGKVQGKERDAKFFAFKFNDKVIASIYEGGRIGARWYWITEKKGSRYGNPMLLSYDPEVKDFWIDFCKEFMNSIEIKEQKKIKP